MHRSNLVHGPCEASESLACKNSSYLILGMEKMDFCTLFFEVEILLVIGVLFANSFPSICLLLEMLPCSEVTGLGGKPASLIQVNLFHQLQA